MPHARENRAAFAIRSPTTRERRRIDPELLSNFFRDDEDRAEKVQLVREFFGACLLGIAPWYQRGLIGVGVGANGKSNTPT